MPNVETRLRPPRSRIVPSLAPIVGHAPAARKASMHPSQCVVHDRYSRLCARSADVEVNRDESPPGRRLREVMADNGGWVRKRERAGADRRWRRTARTRATPARHPPLREMSGSSIATPVDGHRDHIGGPIDSPNGACQSDELSRDLRNMAQPRAEVEHARPGRETWLPAGECGSDGRLQLPGDRVSRALRGDYRARRCPQKTCGLPSLSPPENCRGGLYQTSIIQMSPR